MDYNMLVIIWTGIILLGVAIYVVLDGFDLGVGMLYPFVKREEDRTTLMNSIGPVWDGNETWLILGGAALFGIFPIAYSVVLSGFYIPVILLLMALIFRGVSFEFRGRVSENRRNFWNNAFFLGSLFAAFFQGVIAGALVQGFDFMPAADAINAPEGYVSKGALDLVMAGGIWAWLSPFSIVSGLGLTAFYALLGSTWAIKKTEGELQTHIRHLTRKIALLFFLLATIILAWTVMIWQEQLFMAENLWKVYLFGGLYLVAIIVAAILMRSIRNSNTHWQPFVYSLLMAVLGAGALVGFLLPYIVPFQVTIFTAAAPESTLTFSLVGALIFIPLVLLYTGYIYYVFRGKVQGEGY
ncbi:cytochrome d ubiquinol oxidase subunit II [Ignatzschineria cameli]|uniref:Cytochrome d ubiquinol oxidase subunit II n=1 Tax=Ignatzschineria cameli TaxID=2182793 RepID=A0A2U2ARD4_9GAMM|nr:cytochrome d ubiquinol oxidase subunit II [Ignatzschineria cameli]PWD86823.1 cytochrome d ubiquinol oxidase subunit II [Ignatzschineria cameli]PWD91797.1 cytochrome d ubiquinol oxidase subunit II [Ignatzschineria cameli]PWD93617.1 cytochrome d ubiquinol oxidase subunit II [Ignatzschineria cameli]PWD94359.1 cytochrome d ubiquinol oxidase subunit II [Ignatzschineria cameli]